jgi:uncharacterized protein YndB with AHSA1/START domain
MTTATETIQVYRVYIKASPQAVWDAITKSEWTERYGYGTPVEYELRPGGRFVSPTSEAMRGMGAPEVAVDGEVIEADEPRRLVQTWRMAMDETAAAEGFTQLTYEISDEKDGVTTLTVIHDVAASPVVAMLVSGGGETQGAGGGWPWVLSGLKTLLETGAPMNG